MRINRLAFDQPYLDRTIVRCVVTIACCLALSACKHSLQASSRSPVQIADSTQPASQTLKNMIGLGTASSGSTTSTEQSQNTSSLRLCQTEPGTSSCTGPAPTLSAKDLGFIPVTVSIESIDLSDIQETSQGWFATAKLNPLVNGISPWCKKGRIVVEIDDSGRSSTSLDSTWCNWLLYGNIIIEMSFSTEEINPTAGSIAGFYEVHVKGTSNSAASGYLQAKIE